jgi:hypothetical protein
MPNVTLMATSTFYWLILLTTGAWIMPQNLKTRQLCVMAAHTLAFRLPDGSSVASGLTAQPPGKSLNDLTIHTLLKLRNNAELMKIDHGPAYWADVIATNMINVRAAFKILPDGTKAPIGYQRMNCHMVFDVKMEDFRRKARLVAGGHMTKAPPTVTYASVVSRETDRLALTIAALNDLEVKVGDVLNAYITAPITDKVWTTLGPEFGPDAGKTAIIVRALRRKFLSCRPT